MGLRVTFSHVFYKRWIQIYQNVFKGDLAFKQRLKVVVISLTTGVVEQFTGPGDGVVPVAAHALFAIAQP